MTRAYVIAEAGVNHNGDLTRALEMIDVAADAGADAVKFQTFSADSLVQFDAPLADYQRETVASVGGQYALLKSLELSHDEFRAIRARCVERGIEFLSTAFDLRELDFLLSELQIARVKIASGDLTFAPLVFAAGRSGRPSIVSTGMADLEEIREALVVLGIGYAVHDGALPSGTVPTAAVRDAHREQAIGWARDRTTVLQCTTQYPAPLDALNLRAMQTIGEEFEVAVGFSDHSLGTLAATVAVGLGASVIEKHFTLDKTLEGPDHRASLEPAELADLVRSIRSVGEILGTAEKRCQPAEQENRHTVRRGLVLRRAVAAGTVITADDIDVRRPADGMPPAAYWDVIGTGAVRDFEAGEHVEL